MYVRSMSPTPASVLIDLTYMSFRSPGAGEVTGERHEPGFTQSDADGNVTDRRDGLYARLTAFHGPRDRITPALQRSAREGPFLSVAFGANVR
jgi:hypothetical protein